VPPAPAPSREPVAARPAAKREAPPEPPPPPQPERTPFVVDAYTSPRGISAVPGTDVPVMCVTSPKGGAGKTTVTLNLAVALAHRGKRVVVVDADHNGILLALNAEQKSNVGAYDVIAGKVRLADAAIQTRIGGLRILPSGVSANPFGASRDDWRKLLAQASAGADLVLVDVAAGMHGPTAEICAGCTHALIVVPAEPVALRGLAGHLERIERLSPSPPKSVGIVLNMLDYRARASLDVMKELCTGPSGQWVFDVPIARSAAFMEAVARGLPLSRGERVDAPAVGWVFEMLASGILERLGIGAPAMDDAPLL
jgi:chromosome partitioning protein